MLSIPWYVLEVQNLSLNGCSQVRNLCFKFGTREQVFELKVEVKLEKLSKDVKSYKCCQKCLKLSNCKTLLGLFKKCKKCYNEMLLASIVWDFDI